MRALPDGVPRDGAMHPGGIGLPLLLGALALTCASCGVAGAQQGVGCGAAGPEPARAPGAIVRRVAHHPAGARTGAHGATLTLRINLPAYRLDVVLDSVPAWSYGVAVGTRRYRTPTGAYGVHRVVWNPWWIPPDSPWAQDDTVTPPGPANPMGRVKLLLGGPYYVHGTPFVTSIGRAASHGCVRMRDDDAIALAKLVQAWAGVAMTDSAVAAVLADTATTHAVDLPVPVPLDIVYEIAEVRHDSLVLHPDVYGRDGARARALALGAVLAAGRDTSRLRSAVLRTALRRARSRHVAIPLDSLLRDQLPRDTSFNLPRTP